MKIYSRDIYIHGFRNKYGLKKERKVCAPCNYNKCKPLELDDLGASVCKTQFINAEGKILGNCECIGDHGENFKVVR